MPDIDQYLHTLSFHELLWRLGLAALLGFIVGIERDVKSKPIDFRAYIVIAVTACMLTIMASELPYSFSANDMATLDIGKIIAGVLTGIGFVGAGAIIHTGEKKVIGTTTGTSIWGAGAIGMALGFGFYLIAGVTSVALFATLILLGYVSRFLENRIK